jgi:uncharacterized protein YbjT (DUF2867 family)
MITVMGATGNVGRKIVHRLLGAGEPVRAIGRNPRALAELGAAGAELRAGDAADAAFLAEAFHGADAVHAMLPYSPATPAFRAEQTQLGETIVTAIRDSGVRKVVAQSSLGADLPAGTGFIAASLHPQEQRLRALDGVDVLFLRPALFFESIVAAVEIIEATGVNADVIDPDVPLPMVSTHDVAEAAAAALRSRDWLGGDVRELLGPRDLTYTEVTRILGTAMGRPGLRYVQLPADEMAAALVQAGFTPDAAALHVEMGEAISGETITPHEGRTPQNTTPTRFEDVVSELLEEARSRRRSARRRGAGERDRGDPPIHRQHGTRDPITVQCRLTVRAAIGDWYPAMRRRDSITHEGVGAAPPGIFSQLRVRCDRPGRTAEGWAWPPTRSSSPSPTRASTRRSVIAPACGSAN